MNLSGLLRLRINSVKHLLCSFGNSLEKGKSRFFVAMLLRMTERVNTCVMKLCGTGSTLGAKTSTVGPT